MPDCCQPEVLSTICTAAAYMKYHSSYSCSVHNFGVSCSHWSTPFLLGLYAAHGPGIKWYLSGHLNKAKHLITHLQLGTRQLNVLGDESRLGTKTRKYSTYTLVIIADDDKHTIFSHEVYLYA